MSEKIKEYPILFTGPMVKAILDDKKHMTRRLVKPQPMDGVRASPFVPSGLEDMHGRELRCPYAKERLWVKETFLHATHVSLTESGDHQMSRANLVEYVADGAQPRYLYPGVGGSPYMQKRPSIFMPRWASRLLLENLGVRIERVQDISEQDILAEGITVDLVAEWCNVPWSDMPTLYDAWRVAWVHVNGPESWERNDLVWAISFRRIQEGAR